MYIGSQNGTTRSGTLSGMRLVLATPLYPPDIGGPSTYAKLLVEGLHGKGIEVGLVSFSEVRHLPKLVRHYAYYRKVRAALRRADAVLALDPVSVGLPTMYAARKEKKPFLVKIVGDYAWEQGRQRFGIVQNLDEFAKTKQSGVRVRLLQAIQTLVAQRATRVIVPSEYLKGVVTAWGIPSGKIQVIYNAISLEKLSAVPEAVAGLPRPLLVSAGRLVPWKHMDGIISAVAELRRTGSAASFALVGDGPERARLTALAEQHLSDGFVFTGTLTHSAMLGVIQTADVFVLNSSYEGLSHLLIEALMLGVPVVATRVGGNPEVITDGENGLLVPEGDTPALVAALVRVLSDTKLRARLSAHASDAAKHFSIETMLAATATLLSTV